MIFKKKNAKMTTSLSTDNKIKISKAYQDFQMPIETPEREEKVTFESYKTFDSKMEHFIINMPIFLADSWNIKLDKDDGFDVMNKMAELKGVKKLNEDQYTKEDLTEITHNACVLIEVYQKASEAVTQFKQQNDLAMLEQQLYSAIPEEFKMDIKDNLTEKQAAESLVTKEILAPLFYAEFMKGLAETSFKVQGETVEPFKTDLNEAIQMRELEHFGGIAKAHTMPLRNICDTGVKGAKNLTLAEIETILNAPEVTRAITLANTTPANTIMQFEQLNARNNPAKASMQR